MRIVLLYLILIGGVSAILYGIPTLKQFRLKHKRNVFLSIGIGIILVTIIYLLEQT